MFPASVFYILYFSYKTRSDLQIPSLESRMVGVTGIIGMGGKFPRSPEKVEPSSGSNFVMYNLPHNTVSM